MVLCNEVIALIGDLMGAQIVVQFVQLGLDAGGVDGGQYGSPDEHFVRNACRLGLGEKHEGNEHQKND
jgi:hypothetical protein